MIKDKNNFCLDRSKILSFSSKKYLGPNAGPQTHFHTKPWRARFFVPEWNVLISFMIVAESVDNWGEFFWDAYLLAIDLDSF